MRNIEYEKLIDDALFFRRTQTDRSCLVTNQAGEDLTKQTSSILPFLEKTILETIAPAFAGPKVADFPGLAHVLGAYLLIGARSNASNTVDFLQGLPAELQTEAVGILPIFFNHQDGRYRYDTPMPKEFLNYLKLASQSKVSILRAKALRSFSFLSPWSPPACKRCLIDSENWIESKIFPVGFCIILFNHSLKIADGAKCH